MASAIEIVGNAVISQAVVGAIQRPYNEVRGKREFDAVAASLAAIPRTNANVVAGPLPPRRSRPYPAPAHARGME